MIIRKCPICSENKTEDCKISSIPKAENLSFELVSEYWNDNIFNRKIFFTYLKCDNCKLTYCQQYFDNEELQNLYQNMKENMSEVGEIERNYTQQGYKNNLNKLKIVDGDYLEIGPDIGLFAKIIKESSFKINFYHLFEPNKKIKKHLEKNIEGAEFKIYGSMTDFTKIKDNSISLAVAIHVMDHLIAPKKVLDDIFPKIKKGGLLLIVTHDKASILAKILRNKWPPYCLQHPQLYDCFTTKTLLSSVGFKVALHEKSKNYFTIGYLGKHLLNIFGIKINLGILNWVIGLKLGNIITIAIKE
jgi:2-polyprenyl-3-methyl-5-hydroxy-6-metoxy-1,4-benzoquinol methylase